MAKHPYRTAPLPIRGMPPGIPYIVANEAAERFSFYGMKTILTVFMTKYLLDRYGAQAPMPATEAVETYHLFVWGVYFCPIIGAILADGFLGKYRTVLWLSIVYCLGHLALALDDTRLGLSVGLVLIALGSGGIKPCTTANVGDQFGASNKHLLEKVYGWFYFSINFGSFFSTLLIPELLDRYGPHVAFAVPGVLMALATLCFWLGRHKFVHIPPGGWGFLRESFSGEGLRALGRLTGLYLFVAVFWSLYEQTGSTWVLQAEHMDRIFLWHEWLPSQIQAINPLLIMAFIPLFSYVLYPAISKVFPLTSLRKIGIGFCLIAAAYAITGKAQEWIEAGDQPNIGWQILAYVLLTAAEVMVSTTCLEFSYTQAPRKMKSAIMALYYLSVSAGQLLTIWVNKAQEKKVLNLSGPQYFWFFAGVMLAATVVFALYALTFQTRIYVQDEQPDNST